MNRPTSLGAAIALTVIAMAAFLVLPLYVGAAAQHLALSQQQLGFFAAAVATGSAISSVAMMFLVRRLPWRPMAWAALVLMLAPMTMSLWVDSAAAFMALQAVAALGGGSLYSLALTALADSRHPDRAFGFSVAAQVAFQVLGMLLLPGLVSRAGLDGVLLVFIAMELLGLLLVRTLPDTGKPLPPVVGRAAIVSLPALLALAGCFCFFFNIGAVWAYLERMAVLAGFEFMSERLAVGLDSGDQEDEHSCFSDTTHQDFVYDLKGISNVWKGEYPNVTGPGMREVVARVDEPYARDESGDAAVRSARMGR